MERIVRVHYGGEVVEAGNGGANFSSSMKVKVIAFKTCPKLDELECRVKEVLGWNENGLVIKLQGRYDVGHGHSHKVMMQLDNQDEWEAYILAVRESQWKCLEVVAVQDIHSILQPCDLNILAVCEHGVDSSRYDGVQVAELVGGFSQAIVGEGTTEAAGFETADPQPLKQQLVVSSGVLIGGMHEDTEVERICEAKRELALDEFDAAVVGDELTPRVFNEDTTDDIAYDAEYAADSEDDRPIGGMTEEDCRVFEAVIGRHPSVSEFRDIVGVDGAIVDEVRTMSMIPDANESPIVHAGIEFPTLMAS